MPSYVPRHVVHNPEPVDLGNDGAAGFVDAEHYCPSEVGLAGVHYL